MRKVTIFLLSILPVLFTTIVWGTPGKVYLVLGSDTAIWDGMNTRTYHNFYNDELYANPMNQTVTVMDETWRSQFVDSSGETMKLTWWMMAGNIFRYATNMNMPYPNIMTLYLMKKYHGDAVEALGDELTLHYHTFYWSDFDQDGIYWWNQALDFNQSSDDFDYTLAQFLLEEQVFPVSFRSGWHYMDNHWQARLNEILPYSLHNAYPSHGTDDEEPTDNVIDWSQAPAEWVPFQPSPDNYQLPGGDRGWNVRSTHFRTILNNRAWMDSMFARAERGIDQVACLWGHLPEDDFAENIARIDTMVHGVSAEYPAVDFEYATAVEAMKHWRNTTDDTPPEITVDVVSMHGQPYLQITTNEPIFQTLPIVAHKDIYENFRLLSVSQVSSQQWRTGTFDPASTAKIGIVVTDTVGNQQMEFLQYRPDDFYTDDESDGFTEIRGNFTSSDNAAWGRTASTVTIPPNDSAIVEWAVSPSDTGRYNVFAQFPETTPEGARLKYSITSNGQTLASTLFNTPVSSRNWQYLFTPNIQNISDIRVRLTAKSMSQEDVSLDVDVVKFSGLVRERDISVYPDFLDLGEISGSDTTTLPFRIENQGTEPLTIYALESDVDSLIPVSSLPVVIPGMSRIEFPVYYIPAGSGDIAGAVTLYSDDPVDSVKTIQLRAKVFPYLRIVDNDDLDSYSEYGTWYYSVTQAYGSSSRYTHLNGGYRYAEFSTTVDVSGAYKIFQMVPRTTNSANHALYTIAVNDVIQDSNYVDQNSNSGSWNLVGGCIAPENGEVKIRVINDGTSTGGDVLRADAVKVQFVRTVSDVAADDSDAIPVAFRLLQNYPNPFNASTSIHYHIPKETRVTISVYDVAGRLVQVLTDKRHTPGKYRIDWNATKLSSGVYFYHLSTPEKSVTKKMLLIK